jgi:hypothetical protein
MGSGFDLVIEAEEGEGAADLLEAGKDLLPPMIKAAWQNTPEYEKVKQFIFRSRGAVVILEATCIAHKVKIWSWSSTATPCSGPSQWTCWSSSLWVLVLLN